MYIYMNIYMYDIIIIIWYRSLRTLEVNQEAGLCRAAIIFQCLLQCHSHCCKLIAADVNAEAIRSASSPTPLQHHAMQSCNGRTCCKHWKSMENKPTSWSCWSAALLPQVHCVHFSFNQVELWLMVQAPDFHRKSARVTRKRPGATKAQVTAIARQEIIEIVWFEWLC